MRGRNRPKGPNPLTRSYESNGPDVKIRGTAQHIADKYAQLARDAQSSGDPVAAENYFQHAEHYYRMIAAAQELAPGDIAVAVAIHPAEPVRAGGAQDAGRRGGLGIGRGGARRGRGDEAGEVAAGEGEPDVVRDLLGGDRLAQRRRRVVGAE